MWVQAFHLFSITILSLLLPLSFIVLARLISVRYLLSQDANHPISLFVSFFYYTNPNILCALLSIVGFDALIQTLTQKITWLTELQPRVLHPHIRNALFFLGTLQVCVGLGIEAIRETNFDGAGYGEDESMFSKMLFLVGLFETMLCWCRTMVGPVVDAGLLGAPNNVKPWVEWWALAANFGCLWWWKLRHDVAALVVVVEMKRHMKMRVGLSDVLGLWLYYLIVIVGMARIAKGIVCIGTVILCRQVVAYERNCSKLCENDHQV